MKEVRKDIEAFRRLEQRGYIPQEAIDPLEKKAQEVIGRKVTAEEFMQLSETPPNAWDKLTGFVTFTNIIWVTAGIMLAIAICWLFGIYLLNIIRAIPPPVLEVLCWALALASIFLPKMFMSDDYMLLVAFPACLAIYGCLSYTAHVHELKHICWGHLIATVIWSAAALYYESQVLGFISCLSFVTFLGFSAIMWPGCICIGFEKDDTIPQSMLASLLMLIVYLVIEIGGFSVPYYETFNAGFVFVGCFVYFLGLLIVGNRWYCHENAVGYLAMILLCIVSGVAALYLGSVYHLPTLLGVAGTFFYIWILEKYYEIPWEGSGWAWSLLGLAGILYGFYAFAIRYPQLFIWG